MTIYASVSDLYVYGAPEKAFGQLTLAMKEAALASASSVVDSFYRARFALPLVTWDLPTTEATCRIAAFNLLNIRGYNPAAGSDENILERYKQALAWLEKVQKQQAHPDVVPQPSQLQTYHQPFVQSSSVVNLATGATGANRRW